MNTKHDKRGRFAPKSFMSGIVHKYNKLIARINKLLGLS